MQLRITVISARGLRKGDVRGGSDAYVVVKVPKKKGYTFKTPEVHDTEDPVWNHIDYFLDYIIGDTLQFNVYDKDPVVDDFLGTVSMPSDAFYPHGFSGELSLDKAGKGIVAFIKVKIEVK